jgi:uncharacterized protein (UPF0261 family)
MPAIVIGTLDTKAEEVGFVRSALESAGYEVLVIDVGTGSEPGLAADITREAVLRAAGTTLADVQSRGDRGEAVAAAARGVAEVVAGLWETGRVEGVIALGGSAGTSIGSAAMGVLPLGVPKVLVSTLASGQTRPYVGGSDLVMIPSVCDLAGLNRISRVVLSNAVSALMGMMAGRRGAGASEESSRPLVTATMFGVTTPCVTAARRRLEAAGYEVVVFHATGVGGQAMESLIREGRVSAVLDLTTTELADEIAGGVMSAGPERLSAAVVARIPQVVSVGAVDMVNFGPPETVPERYRSRRLHRHNPQVTLMRTTIEENGAIGRRLAEALRLAQVPTVVLLPLRGVSALDAPGQPFHDPTADQALFEAISAGLAGHPCVRIVEVDAHINDPAFSDRAAAELIRLHEAVDPKRVENGSRP